MFRIRCSCRQIASDAVRQIIQGRHLRKVSPLLEWTQPLRAFSLRAIAMPAPETTADIQSRTIAISAKRARSASVRRGSSQGCCRASLTAPERALCICRCNGSIPVSVHAMKIIWRTNFSCIKTVHHAACKASINVVRSLNEIRPMHIRNPRPSFHPNCVSLQTRPRPSKQILQTKLRPKRKITQGKAEKLHSQLLDLPLEAVLVFPPRRSQRNFVGTMNGNKMFGIHSCHAGIALLPEGKHQTRSPASQPKPKGTPQPQSALGAPSLQVSFLSRDAWGAPTTTTTTTPATTTTTTTTTTIILLVLLLLMLGLHQQMEAGRHCYCFYFCACCTTTAGVAVAATASLLPLRLTTINEVYTACVLPLLLLSLCEQERINTNRVSLSV